MSRRSSLNLSPSRWSPCFAPICSCSAKSERSFALFPEHLLIALSVSKAPAKGSLPLRRLRSRFIKLFGYLNRIAAESTVCRRPCSEPINAVSLVSRSRFDGC